MGGTASPLLTQNMSCIALVNFKRKICENNILPPLLSSLLNIKLLLTGGQGEDPTTAVKKEPLCFTVAQLCRLSGELYETMK